MSPRSSFLVVGGAIGCSLLLLFLFVVAFAGYSYLAPSNAGAVNEIAYVDNADNIQVVDPRGEHRVALTTDASDALPRGYFFPTWSPDSQQVAFVGVSGEGRTRTATLYTEFSTGGNSVTVFNSTTQTPFYLYWSPDSQWIGFLAQSETDMALMLGRVNGQADARKLETGAPFYWAWSPDSRELLLHVGGSARDSARARLALLTRDSAGSPQVLNSDPANFLAPHYSPDGSKVLYAATDGSSGDALFLADAQGSRPRAIATYRGSIAFAWSPDGKKIASLVTPEDVALANFGPIWISDAGGTNRTQLTDEDALAFYWSPDSQQIAFLTVTLQNESQSCGSGCAGPIRKARSNDSRTLSIPQAQSQRLRLRWRVVNIADQRARTLATFVPTHDFLLMLPYFDQYARSLTFWSPDSRRFVYTQAEGDEIGSVWVADVAGDVPPWRVGDGTIAVWSWR